MLFARTPRLFLQFLFPSGEHSEFLGVSQAGHLSQSFGNRNSITGRVYILKSTFLSSTNGIKI